jgi:hypothetical protein
MRRTLMLILLTWTVGCHTLGDPYDGQSSRAHEKHTADRRRPLSGLLAHSCPTCDTNRAAVTGKKDSSGVELVKSEARTEPVESTRTAALAPDVFLVPKTVYIPYAPQSPTTSARVSGPLPIVNLPDEGSRITQVSSRAVGTDSNQQVMEMCKTLNARLDVLEKTVSSKYGPLPASPAPLLRETSAHPVAAPAVIVPTVTTPLIPTNAPATSRKNDLPSSQGLQPCEICPVNPTPLLVK